MKDVRASRIVAAIADAADRCHNADFPARVRITRAIEQRMGYTEPVIDYALDALFGSLGKTDIESAIATELGSVAALDGFVSRYGRPDVTYVAREPIAIVASDTTIGVAIPALIFALCTKGIVRVKDRSDGLVAAFAETLVEELPTFAQTLSVSAWDGSDAVEAARFLSDAGAIVAFGRDETLRSIRALASAEASFVGFGHRTSIVYVARESLGDARTARVIAQAIARDVLLYDGDGCLSAHTIFCESGAAVEPYAFARTLADACDEAAIEFPAKGAEPGGDVVRYRDAARFRAAQGAGAVFGGTIAPHLIVLDPPKDQAPPLYARTAAVFTVAGPVEASSYLSRHALPLEAVALSESRSDLEAFARASGASRICAPGQLQRPPLGGDHGGAGRIFPLVRAIYRA